MSQLPKIPLAQYCILCHTTLVPSPHEVLKIYICTNCEHQKNYSTPNHVARGQMGNLPTFSIEFEVASPPNDPNQARRALVLLQHGFIRTYDATVDDEYKSPIYCSLQAFRKPLEVLDSLKDLVDDRCGTHLHIGCEQGYELHEIRHDVFEPLIDYLQAHEQQTIAFWGRTFCSYARASLANGDRHVCFNVAGHYPTVEFRLPRFRSASQYMRVLRFCRETTASLSKSLDPYQTSYKRLSPEQLGKGVLARYKKAVHALQPSTMFGEKQEEVHTCVD